MPRWLWTVLVVSMMALMFAGYRRAEPPVAVAVGGGSVQCVLPERFIDQGMPRQSVNDGRMLAFRLDQAMVTPLAGFSLQARVLSREDYSLDVESKYSPTDLVLGWGAMADPNISDQLDISQSNRWYQYQWGNNGPPIAPNEIIRSSANMHMIPADRSVADALAKVRSGDTVRVDGWLVNIDDDDGWYWRSSTTREDTGEGACEVVYVCSITR
jgi:hypothetical protein